jgi:hypothetical protein
MFGIFSLTFTSDGKPDPGKPKNAKIAAPATTPLLIVLLISLPPYQKVKIL